MPGPTPPLGAAALQPFAPAPAVLGGGNLTTGAAIGSARNDRRPICVDKRHSSRRIGPVLRLRPAWLVPIRTHPAAQSGRAAAQKKPSRSLLAGLSDKGQGQHLRDADAWVHRSDSRQSPSIFVRRTHASCVRGVRHLAAKVLTRNGPRTLGSCGPGLGLTGQPQRPVMDGDLRCPAKAPVLADRRRNPKPERSMSDGSADFLENFPVHSE